MRLKALDTCTASVPTVVALGFFDGVHLGHQQIIASAVARAAAEGVEAGLFTFRAHPMQVLRPSSAPPVLTLFEEKVALLSQTGLHCVYWDDFTLDFSRLSPEAFARDVLRHRLGVVGTVVGPNYRFGAGASGDVATLAALGAAHGFAVEVVAPFEVDGAMVSSTRVRTAVAAGDVETAARLLGRPYVAQAQVVRGDGRGRTIGFPTANLEVAAEKLLPADGVYAVRVRIADAWRAGVANLGLRPTFDAQRRTLEAHVFDFDGDLYGSPVEIAFHHRIRGEQKFSSVPALIDQIGRDADAARDLLRR